MGVLTIYADILIFGEGSSMEEALTDHDNDFHSLMRKCREQNIKLNQDKVNLQRKESHSWVTWFQRRVFKQIPEKLGRC